MSCPIELKDIAVDEEIAYRATCDRCKLVAYGETPVAALESIVYICEARTDLAEPFAG